MPGAAPIDDLERLGEAVRLVSAPTRELFRNVVEDAGQRASLPGQSSEAARIYRLIEVGAWTEAAISIIAFALPNWTMRRIACEQGEWICSLSRQPNVPLAIDETVDASNPVLALAILTAFVDACLREAAAPHAGPSVPLVGPASGQTICCENFA
jgi:hypothetical protein